MRINTRRSFFGKLAALAAFAAILQQVSAIGCAQL
jgi:hypothetical protein